MLIQYRALVHDMIHLKTLGLEHYEREMANIHAFNQVKGHIMAINDVKNYPVSLEEKNTIALRFAGSILGQAIKTCKTLKVPCSVNPEMFGVSRGAVCFL